MSFLAVYTSHPCLASQIKGLGCEKRRDAVEEEEIKSRDQGVYRRLWANGGLNALLWGKGSGDFPFFLNHEKGRLLFQYGLAIPALYRYKKKVGLSGHLHTQWLWTKNSKCGRPAVLFTLSAESRPVSEKPIETLRIQSHCICSTSFYRYLIPTRLYKTLLTRTLFSLLCSLLIHDLPSFADIITYYCVMIRLFVTCTIHERALFRAGKRWQRNRITKPSTLGRLSYSFPHSFRSSTIYNRVSAIKKGQSFPIKICVKLLIGIFLSVAPSSWTEIYVRTFFLSL